MEFTVRHSIPGRLRLYVPALYRQSSFSRSAIVWLEKQSGIKTVRVNHACASLIIEFDQGASQALSALLFYLSSADLEQIRSLIGQGADGDENNAGLLGRRAVAATPPELPGRWPLVLPTLSLALSFSLHPAVVALNAPLMLWNAFPIAQRAWRAWTREGRLNVDFLDVLAVSASIGQGRLLAGAVITWVICLGDWIRDLTGAGSRRAMSGLLEFQAKAAWVASDGTIVSIPSSQLKVGDTIIVYPGEMIPADGDILRGDASIDQKTITGENLPIIRAEGDAVFAGTVIHEGQIAFRASRVGSQTIAGQIAELVDAAPVEDTRMQNHAERFADRLVLPTLALATGTAFLARDLNRFLSLVIVDYGTGIRVAAPTAVLSSMTRAARAGIIIKSGRHMERLAEADTIVFDKTGTLTHGVPAVIDIISYQRGMSPNHLLALAAAAEARLRHPVAEALRAKARELSLEIPCCDETRLSVGLGVQGQVNGYYLHVGSERFLRQSDIRINPISTERAAFDQRGYSCLYIAIDGVFAGLIPYADQIRPESPSVIRTLRVMGMRNIIMLTGDNAVVARGIAERLGLTRQYADMLPADKAEVIQDLRRDGNIVAMVGDGLNDSPALSYADVGIAMKHGAEVAQESAHVVLLEDSLWKVITAVEISRGAVRLIKQNYGIVATLNTAALALVLALPSGSIAPVITAMISNGSAILASLNGMRPLLRDGLPAGSDNTLLQRQQPSDGATHPSRLRSVNPARLPEGYPGLRRRTRPQ
jgi:Cu2+-exporting ATPase